MLSQKVSLFKNDAETEALSELDSQQPIIYPRNQKFAPNSNQ